MPDQHINPGDQISLSSIKELLLQVIRFCFKIVDFFLTVLIKNYGIILICTIAGFLSGYAYFQLKPQYYLTEMIVTNSNLTRSAYSEIVENLDRQIIARSYDELAKDLLLPIDQVKSIEQLQAKSMEDGPLSGDTSSRLNLSFKISARLNNNDVVKPLQKALIDYLNQNPFNYRIKAGQKKMYLARLQHINKEFANMDTLKMNYNKFLSTSTGAATVYNNAFNPADIYEVSIKLAKEQTEILNWLNSEQEAISLIDGFKTPTENQSMTLKSCLLLGVLFGILLGLIVAILNHVRKYL